ncbi:MAG: hypothetical protein ACI4M3_09470 [Acutalibacteraceae bacterium]
MGKKLKNYIAFIEELLKNPESMENIEQVRKALLTEISFWQHERLIHLLVTILFALLTMMVLLTSLFCPSWGLLALFIMLLVLLIPYIRHYYILENGVQKLYTLYEKILLCEDDKCLPQSNEDISKK